jgi:hypothetical protein
MQFIADDDDSHSLHRHECQTFTSVRVRTAAVAWVSVAAGAFATVQNVRLEKRRRYPGRLVTIFGAAILLFNLTVAMGLVVDFKQLDWGRGSNYKYHYERDDERGDEQWYDVCTAQGVVVEFALVCCLCYACWLCLSFFNVIDQRLRLQRRALFNNASEDGRRALRREAALHSLIALLALGVGLVAAHNGDIVANSGIIACWVGGGTYHQLYYYYIAMTLVLGVGLVHSAVATRRLWRVLRGAGPDDMWTAENRPLRRVVYGNIAWTFTTTFAVVVPLVDVVLDSKLTCELAQICTSMYGIFFLLCYSVVPAYLERIFERARVLSTASVSVDGGGTLNRGLLLDEDEYAYAAAAYFDGEERRGSSREEQGQQQEEGREGEGESTSSRQVDEAAAVSALGAAPPKVVGAYVGWSH